MGRVGGMGNISWGETIPTSIQVPLILLSVWVGPLMYNFNPRLRSYGSPHRAYTFLQHLNHTIPNRNRPYSGITCICGELNEWKIYQHTHQACSLNYLPNPVASQLQSLKMTVSILYGLNRFAKFSLSVSAFQS